MVRILGLDIASSTGFCLLDYARPCEDWDCGTIEVEGEFHEEKCDDFQGALFELLGGDLPDFAAIETPLRNVKAFEKVGSDMAGESAGSTVNAGAALLLNQLAGAAVATLRVCNIPFGLITPQTWRPAYYGKGFQPPTVKAKKWDRKLRRQVEYDRPDWKTAAINLARLQRIFLPDTKKAQRDAAEAIGIGTAWAKCTQIPKRHQAAFLALRQLPVAAPVPADLFTARAA